MPSFSRDSRSRNRSHRRHRRSETRTPIVEDINPSSIYVVQPGETFEIIVIGHRLRLSHFAPVEGGINFNNPMERQPAYCLMYRYATVTRSLCIHSIYFVGEEPDIHILYQDDRYPLAPIREYRVIYDEITDSVRLRLVHSDVRHDAQRTNEYDQLVEQPIGLAVNDFAF